MNRFLVGSLVALSLGLGIQTANAQDIKGDAQAGAKKNAMCIGCHGINGYHTGFPEVYHVPKLSGQSAAYLVSALNAYKSGERKHPSMGTMALSLSNKDMADLAAYYESTGLASAAAAKPIDKTKGVALVEKGGCQGCHGENFSKPIAPNYPIVAGQYSDYVYNALRAYKTDNKPQVGRSNPIMGAVAKQFSDEELQELAHYVESLPTTLHTIQPSRFR
jgi:cytochrome c553